MNEFVIFGDIQYHNNVSKSYTRSDGLSSWLHTQVQVTKQVFDYARDNNVRTVIHNGDLFEEKNRINVNLYNIIWELYRQYSEEGFKIIINTGNHDFLTINRSSSLKPFSRIARIIDKPTDITDSLRIIPYGMTQGNLAIPNVNTTTILCIHEDIAELKLGPTDYPSDSRLKYQIFSDWDIVFNGHIHKPQRLHNIYNIGSPMIQSWGEAGEEKRFLHYKEGQVVSIPTTCPQFYEVKGLSDKIKKTIENDDYNFYRISITPEAVGDPIFKNYNISYNIIKSEKRKVRLKDNLSDEEELKAYINIKDTNLNTEKLLRIGLELMKGE